MPRQETGPPLAARKVAATFTVNGRIAVRETSEAKRGFSGGFVWVHKPGEDVVELLTPLGQIAARMTMTPAGADIELADGQRSRTADPERFLSQSLGVSLPLAALPYWMQAAPVPSVPSRAEADPAGRPVALWQNGWQIRFAAYADDTTQANPTRIDLRQGDVEARLIISEWKAP